MFYYSIQYFTDLDNPMFRICYKSKYYTGSYPITCYADAIDFIKNEFGSYRLTYGMTLFRTELAEMLLEACQKMEAEKY